MALNLYKKLKDKYKDDIINPEYMKKHIFNLPCRILIVGASNAGKTNTAFNILQNMNNTFIEVIICAKSDTEPLYDVLKDKLKNKLKIFIGQIPLENKKKGTQPNIPKIEEIEEKDDKGYIPKLIIFDDLCLEKNQDRISEYFIRGRKKNITCIYLSQSYYKTDKAIRLNINYLILKRNVMARDLNQILRAANLPLKNNDMVKMYRDSTRTMEDFLNIDLEKGNVYKSFELEPIYKSLEESYEGDENEEIKIENLDNEKYKYDSLKLLGISAFINNLKKQHINKTIPFKDIAEAYKGFCSKNNFEISKNNLLAKYLKKAGCEMLRYNKLTYYYI